MLFILCIKINMKCQVRPEPINNHHELVIKHSSSAEMRGRGRKTKTYMSQNYISTVKFGRLLK